MVVVATVIVIVIGVVILAVVVIVVVVLARVPLSFDFVELALESKVA